MHKIGLKTTQNQLKNYAKSAHKIPKKLLFSRDWHKKCENHLFGVKSQPQKTLKNHSRSKITLARKNSIPSRQNQTDRTKKTAFLCAKNASSTRRNSIPSRQKRIFRTQKTAFPRSKNASSEHLNRHPTMFYDVIYCNSPMATRDTGEFRYIFEILKLN